MTRHQFEAEAEAEGQAMRDQIFLVRRIVREELEAYDRLLDQIDDRIEAVENRVVRLENAVRERGITSPNGGEE